MRRIFLLAASFFVVSILEATAQTQQPVAYSNANVPTGYYSGSTPDSAATRNTSATMVLHGRVESPTGPLPGAVIQVKNSKLATVTNADGTFSLSVPATSGPLLATASYAGYEDVPVTLATGGTNNTVKLATPHVIKMARKYQLKTYLKTARRQSRRTLRKA